MNGAQVRTASETLVEAYPTSNILDAKDALSPRQ